MVSLTSSLYSLLLIRDHAGGYQVLVTPALRFILSWAKVTRTTLTNTGNIAS